MAIYKHSYPEYSKGPRVRWQVNLDQTITEIHKIKVHEFQMSDVDDPEFYVQMTIEDWQKTSKGKFVSERSVNGLEILRTTDLAFMGHRYAILAELDYKSLAEYILRYGDQQGN